MATPTVLQAARVIAQQKGLYKKLFTQGANGFSVGASILQNLHSVFELAGVKLPENTQIGLDSAQMLLAGGAFVDDLALGSSVLQSVGDASNAIAGVTQLLGGLGLIDKQFADFAGLISNVSLAIASGGANVLADIGAVISLINVVGDLGNDFFGNSDAAKSAAMKSLSDGVHSFVNNQISYASSQARAYNSGQLDIFDFIANVALNAPLTFPGFFPDLKTYFPSWITYTFYGTGQSSGWFSSQRDTERFQLTEMFTTKSEIEDVLLEVFLWEPLQSYKQEFTIDRVASIEALSYLSLLLSSGTKGPVEMNFGFDIVSALQMLGVTPYILGDDWLFKGFMRNEPELDQWQDTLPYQPLTIPYKNRADHSGLVINGKEVLTQSEKDQKKVDQELKSFQIYMQSLDEKGDIDTLIKIPEARAILNKWASIQYDPSFDVKDGTVKNMALNRGSIDVSQTQWFKSDIKNKRDPKKNPLFWPYIHENYGVDITDYWKILSTLKTMQKSNILGDVASRLTRYGNIDKIESTFQRIYQYVLVKNINRLARVNLAKSLDIPPEKLGSRTTSDGTLIFYRKEA